MLKKFSAAWQAFRAPEEKASFTEAFLRGEEDSIRGTIVTNAYQQVSWIYACVTTLSENVSGIPFRFLIGNEDNEDVLQEGEIVELFNRPHPQLDRFQFWELIVCWLSLRGEAFIVPLNGEGRAAGKVERLLVLNPDHFREVIADHELLGWRYTGYGLTGPMPSMVFTPDEVIHIKLPNPQNFWRGMSPLLVAEVVNQGDYAAAQFMKGTMVNNADTGLVVTTENQATDLEKVQITAALKERKRRAGTSDKPMFLWGGAKVEKPTISMVDMQFLENRKFNRQEICAIYKVPQELLGFTEDANRSVSDAARLNFVENRIAPLCKRIEAGIEPVIKRLDPKLRAEFHIKGTPIMQAAQRSRWDTGVKMFGVGVPLNDINESLDLGLRKLPHGNKSYLPFSLQEVGADGSLEDPKPKEPAAGEQPEDKLLRLLTAPKRKHICTGPAADAYSAAIAGSVKLKRGKLRKFFFEQRQRVLSQLDQLDKDAKGADGAGGTLSPTVKAIEDIFDAANEDKILWDRMKVLLRNDLMFGAAQVAQELGIADFELPPERAIEFLNTRRNEIEGINDTTFEQLKGSLQEGLADGDTMQELQERVKEVFNASDSRAETIALTETNVATNSGRFEGMKIAGVEKKGWQASNLENVRAAHLQAERDYSETGIPIDEPFYVGGEKLMHPGDPNGSPENTINCRCFTFAVVEEKAVRPAKFLNFTEWRGK